MMTMNMCPKVCVMVEQPTDQPQTQTDSYFSAEMCVPATENASNLTMEAKEKLCCHLDFLILRSDTGVIGATYDSVKLEDR